MDKPVTPVPVLRMLTGFWVTQTLAVAVELDVFTLVSKGVNTVEDVAAQLAAKARPVEMLLNALVALELLEKRGQKYRNTAVSEAFLVAGSPGYYGDLIAMMTKRNYVTWGNLKESVLANKGQVDSVEKAFQNDPDFVALFTRAMHCNAMAPAPALVSAVDFSGTRRFLDLGGGSGAYSITLAKKYPNVEAIVYDTPSVCSIARQYIDQSGVSAQVTTMGGNILKDDIPAEVDDVLISHVLHAYSPRNCVRILKRAFAALVEGGRALVVEFFLNDDKRGPLYSTLFALNMLVGTRAGNAYSFAEIREFLRTAGFDDFETKDLPGPGTLMIAKKPS